MRFIVIDTETTGFDPEMHRIVEFAAMELRDGQTRELFDFMCNPGRDIPPEASAVHHIIMRDVETLPTFEDLWPAVEKEILVEPDTVLVAHNADFDKAFVPPIRNVPWLCTMRLAKHIWPDAPEYKNQTLRYWRGIDIQTGVPHRAMSDVQVTTEILKLLLAERDFKTVHEWIEFCNAPFLVQNMPFGKHKGMPIKDIPMDYIQWALKNINDMDTDLRYTLQKREREWNAQLNRQIELEGITDNAWDKPSA